MSVMLALIPGNSSEECLVYGGMLHWALEATPTVFRQYAGKQVDSVDDEASLPVGENVIRALQSLHHHRRRHLSSR